MKEREQKAKEYCNKNIPSFPQMRLAISTAFEAGWEAALEYMSKIPSTEIIGVLTELKNHDRQLKRKHAPHR